MLVEHAHLAESPRRPASPAPSDPPRRFDAPAATVPAHAPSGQCYPSAPSVPSPPPLPPIPAADRPLLLRLITLNENYPAVAAELATEQWNHLGPDRPKDLLDLYAWAERPEIVPWIERFRAMTDLQCRTLALNTLEEVIKSSPTPTERRRAATTILRALDHRWPRERYDRRDRPPRASPIQNPQSKIQNRSPAPPEPAPSITPDLRHSPRDLAAAIAIDLRDEFPMQALSTIAALLSSYGPIADEEVLEKRVQKPPPLSDQAHLSDPTPFTPPRPLAEGQQLIITDPPTGTTITLKFVRFTNKPWRIFDLNTG